MTWHVASGRNIRLNRDEGSYSMYACMCNCMYLWVDIFSNRWLSSTALRNHRKVGREDLCHYYCLLKKYYFFKARLIILVPPPILVCFLRLCSVSRLHVVPSLTALFHTPWKAQNWQWRQSREREAHLRWEGCFLSGGQQDSTSFYATNSFSFYTIGGLPEMTASSF